MVKDALHILNGLNLNLNNRITEHKECPCKCIATMRNPKLLVPLQFLKLLNPTRFVFNNCKFCIHIFIYYVCWLLHELIYHNVNKLFCFLLPNNWSKSQSKNVLKFRAQRVKLETLNFKNFELWTFKFYQASSHINYHNGHHNNKSNP